MNLDMPSELRHFFKRCGVDPNQIEEFEISKRMFAKLEVQVKIRPSAEEVTVTMEACTPQK